VGLLDSIAFISLCEVSVDLLCQFPLDRIEQLFLVGDFVLKFRDFHRSFQSLKALSLKWHYFDPPIELPFLGYISLETLELVEFKSFDVTGLNNLKSLNYVTAQPVTIVGKEKLSSLLKRLFTGDTQHLHSSHLNTLHYCYSLYPTNDIQWNEINNIRLLHLTIRQLDNDAITVGEGVRSLELSVSHLKIIEFSKPQNIFQLSIADLQSFSKKELCRFSHLENVELLRSPNLTDVSEIQHVPMIQISCCKAIRNFSCLGKSQRFLSLDYCDSLQDSDLASFGSIHTLRVQRLPKDYSTN
jgi:hypothetical protein